MKTVSETCKPRESILQGTFNPEVFTAALGPVISFYKGESVGIDAIYTDAKVFFSDATYPTDGLKQTVNNVFRRISGDAGVPSIQRMETGFGGGKTHTLIACVHIAYRGKELSDVTSDIIDARYLPEPNSVHVVGIAGDELPVNKTKGDRLIPYTLWGEMAYQIGGEALYKEVKEDAESFAAPGKPFFEKVLGDKKVLIMLDELAQYAARLEVAVAGKGSNQLASFIMALNGYAKSHAGIAIIVTLAGSADAFSSQTETLTKLLNQVSGTDMKKDDAVAVAERASKNVASVLMRDATSVTPVQSAEIASVLAKRLFTSVDRGAAEEVADAYQEMYQRNSSLLPEDAINFRFHDRMVANYPFHPTLIDFLNKKLAQAENFQGTRGVLRVLAMTVRSIWTNKSKASLIHIGDIDLHNSGIVDEILGRTASADLRFVLDTDIGSAESVNLHGSMSNAQKADSENRHPDGIPFYEITWKTVFLNSLVGRSEGKNSKVFGISQQDAVFEAATPSLTPPQVKTALDKISDSAFYLRYEDGKYYAHTEPTINSVLAQIRQTVDNKQIAQKLKSVANGIAQDNSIFHVEHNVYYSQDIPDKQEKPTLACVALDADPINIKEMFTTRGDGIPRMHQNMIVLLVPKTVKVVTDVEQVDILSNSEVNPALSNDLRDIARMVIAINMLESKPQEYGIPRSKLSDPEFVERKNERNIALSTTVAGAYTGFYYAGHGGFEHKELRSAAGEGGAQILAQIQEALIDAGEMVFSSTDKFGAAKLKTLADGFFFKNDDKMSCLDILGNFYKVRSWPILVGKSTLEKLLREGVESGTWVAYKNSDDPADTLPAELYSQEKTLPMSIDLLSGGYSIMTVAGAKRRGWMDSDKVADTNVKAEIKTVMQNAEAVRVSDIISAVQARYCNATEEQVHTNIKDMIQSGGFSLYEGEPEQKSKPSQMVDGYAAYRHDIKPDDVLITKFGISERGWYDSGRTSRGVHLDGNSAAKKVFPLLRQFGSLYNRKGATSTIDEMDITDLKMLGGGTMRITIEGATPVDVKRMEEFFQCLCDCVKVTDETEMTLDINNPEDGCALVEELKK